MPAVRPGARPRLTAVGPLGLPGKILAIDAALDAAAIPHAFGGALALGESIAAVGERVSE